MSTRWEDLPSVLRLHLENAARDRGGVGVAAVLSPMMSCEEAWLLARFIRGIATQATLVLGHVPIAGDDEVFPKCLHQEASSLHGQGRVGGASLGAVPSPCPLPEREGGRDNPAARFVIRAEKCPNRRGIETLLRRLGGPTATFREFLGQAVEGRFAAAYVVGGYPHEWATPETATALARVPFLVVHDLFPSALNNHAAVQIPASAWAEREGTFMNCDGLVQQFERAVSPPEGVKADGQFFHELAGHAGLYRAEKVRAEMAADMPEFASVFVPRELPEHQH